MSWSRGDKIALLTLATALLGLVITNFPSSGPLSLEPSADVPAGAPPPTTSASSSMADAEPAPSAGSVQAPPSAAQPWVGDRQNPAREAKPLINRHALGGGSYVLAVDSEGNLDARLGQLLADALQARADLFLPAFVSHGAFGGAFAGDPSILYRLKLDASITGTIYFAQMQSALSRADWPAEGLYRAESTLTIRRYELQGRYSSTVQSARGLSSAFSEAEALRRSQVAALENLLGESL